MIYRIHIAMFHINCDDFIIDLSSEYDKVKNKLSDFNTKTNSINSDKKIIDTSLDFYIADTQYTLSKNNIEEKIIEFNKEIQNSTIKFYKKIDLHYK